MNRLPTPDQCSTAAFLTAVLLCLHLSSSPAFSSSPNTVQSISVSQVDDILRQPGHWLVVIMAAWCAPCIRELPDVNTLARTYRPQGLKTLGISVDYGGPAAIQPIVDRLRIRFPVYWTGEASLDHFQITKIPLLMFVRNGRIVERLEGYRGKGFLEKRIDRFLAAP